LFAERYFYIAKINLRLSLFWKLLISILFLGFSPFILGVENLDRIQSAQVLEMYVALIGIILLSPVFYPEQDKNVRELVEAKYTPILGVYLVRLIEALVSLVILIGGYVILLKNNNCTFPLTGYYLGTLAEALFLGGLGFFAYSIFDQIAIAYMLPMIYYVLAFSGNRYLKSFYLFSMMKGRYEEKIYLAAAGGVLLLAGLGSKYLLKRFR
jgi:hypothetical protein